MTRHNCYWFAPANKRARGTRAAWVADFPPAGEVSGVYAIADLDGVVLYVGESHTGRLRKTVARHFQDWSDPRQPRFTYDRFQVQLCWLETADADAQAVEAQWIEELDPRDNLAAALDKGYPSRSDYDDQGDDLGEVETADDEVPF
jgi:hypothetical protein